MTIQGKDLRYKEIKKEKKGGGLKDALLGLIWFGL